MPAVTTPPLSQAVFEKIRSKAEEISGIHIRPGKCAMVSSRLVLRLRALHLASFEEYLEHLERDPSGAEATRLLDALTTNKTSLFREPQHFEHLRTLILPELKAKRQPMRFWSAGCSSGEEPVSIAITFREELCSVESLDVRILATDLSSRMIERARKGVFSETAVKDLSPHILKRHFQCIRDDPPRAYSVRDGIKRLIRYAELNLMETWPMQGQFNVIFCRNVMIYFNPDTQKRLVQRFWEKLKPGGYLFVGHSEGFTASTARFRYVQPAVYRKEEMG